MALPQPPLLVAHSSMSTQPRVVSAHVSLATAYPPRPPGWSRRAPGGPRARRDHGAALGRGRRGRDSGGERADRVEHAAREREAGIGVSGAPSEVDEAIGQVAIDALAVSTLKEDERGMAGGLCEPAARMERTARDHVDGRRHIAGQEDDGLRIPMTEEVGKGQVALRGAGGQSCAGSDALDIPDHHRHFGIIRQSSELGH